MCYANSHADYSIRASVVMDVRTGYYVLATFPVEDSEVRSDEVVY